MVDIKQADADTKELYNYLADISDSIIKRYSAPLDDIVKKLSKDIDTCSNEELRNYMGRLSIEAFNLGMFREQSALKESCAEALYKEGVAKSYLESTGTVEAKKNTSVMNTADRHAVHLLYKSVSDMFKTKVDEAHRIVGAINGILISRAADAKISYNPRSEDTSGVGFTDMTPDEVDVF